MPRSSSALPVQYRFLAVIETQDPGLVQRLTREFPDISVNTLDDPQQGALPARDPDADECSRVGDHMMGLTPRQRQILPLLQDGCSNKEIARALNLSHFTIRNHIVGIFRAFGVTNRRDLKTNAMRCQGA